MLEVCYLHFFASTVDKNPPENEADGFLFGVVSI